MRRLKTRQKANIVKQAEAGYPAVEIAEAYGVDVRTVRRILANPVDPDKLDSAPPLPTPPDAFKNAAAVFAARKRRGR